jgi:hypothetical protein
MSEIPNKSEQPQELDDFDVEGHGLKEVALGLSAAGIVAGGAGAASLALDNPLPGTTAGVQAAVAGVHSDVDERLTWTQGAAAGAFATAGAAATDVQQLADRTGTFAVSTATTTAQPVVDIATGAVTAATDLAGAAAADPIGTSDRLVDETLQTVRDTRGEAIATATDAVERVEQTASTAVTTVGQTADAAVAAVDPQVGVESEEGETTVSVSAAGKSVTVQTG